MAALPSTISHPPSTPSFRLRTIFMGTAELACASLRALAESAPCELVAVVTQPDKPRGRDLKLQPPPVKELALRLNLPVLQPPKARDPQFITELAALKPDLIVVAAYGQILPQSILDLPRYGCLNVHTSLLPRYRGAAPIQWAILNDDAETGVTIMQMDAGLDTGPILSMARTPIAPEDNAQTLHDRLAGLGAKLLVQTIPDYVAGSLHVRPQPVEGASYARKITKEDGHLDWSLPARVLWCRVRGLAPWPGAFIHLPAQPRPLLLKIWQAAVVSGSQGVPGTVLATDKSGIVMACGQGALRILELQLEGRRRLSAQEFLMGHPNLLRCQLMGEPER
jgi:methionyl-tRNA formyltransferase